MSKHQKCILCNSQSLKKLNTYKKDYLVKCNSCGFVFSEMIPTEEELVKHYEGYSRNDYLSDITIKRYNELLDEFEKYRKTNKIIDVGCGIGYFLDEAKKRGWEVYGTEYTDEAVNICKEKGISMTKGVLDIKNYQPESFDIITSFEVIEHINNPQIELSNFHKILRNKGLVYVTTPNFNSLLRYRLKSYYDIICYPEHLSYYTPKTLKKIFKISNFSTVKVKTTGISITRLKRGIAGKSNSKKEEIISKTSSDEKIRARLDNHLLLQLLKRSINWVLTLLGVGDSLKGYFIKK